ncbi:hypothetical protein [Rhodococcoides corynebacterioides]|uniref:TetR family transcriptional regulator n=1 Tax=Rhodococcoides corynebacterioides TaxID=53972 RepID=A0ABS7NYI4_9NOCA|nr:hypothetical protein [Rhodococcus corynebacterioides]MBY6348974.1 hypothetical protein [Rhodococcus corynebacterioides]MBY6365209.1 hypothetical protein [Rhodococcus corynebacterioides]MBY6406621.1 hypothetical protein [Rhodococcus corynebacterioides]
MAAAETLLATPVMQTGLPARPVRLEKRDEIVVAARKSFVEAGFGGT